MLKAPEALELLPPVKGSTSRSELPRLAARWDVVGRLYVVRQDETNEPDAEEVSGILKREATETQTRSTRQIVNCKRRNHREHPLGGYNQRLPLATLFNNLTLGSDFVALGSMDDLSNFFHCFQVNESSSWVWRYAPCAAYGPRSSHGWSASTPHRRRWASTRLPGRALAMTLSWTATVGRRCGRRAK